MPYYPLKGGLLNSILSCMRVDFAINSSVRALLENDRSRVVKWYFLHLSSLLTESK